MNKAEIIEAVARELDVPKAPTERTINAFLSEIKKAIAKGKAVQLTGFGTFRARARKARPGRNPRTGKRIRLKASRTVAFKTARPFKRSL